MKTFYLCDLGRIGVMVFLIHIFTSQLYGQKHELPPVHLNHIYVVVGENTFQKALNSKFLHREFAATDTGLAEFKTVNPSSTIIYVRGKNTYLELMGPGNRFGEPVGKVGVGFCVEKPQGINEICKGLKLADIKFHQHLQKWRADSSDPVNWFHSVFVNSKKNAKLVWWVSELHPDFLQAVYPEYPKLHGKIKRQCFLEPIYDETRLLGDFTDLTLRMHDEQLRELSKNLQTLGFCEQKSDANVVFSTPGFNIHVKPIGNEDRELVESISFSTNQSHLSKFEKVTIGKSLVFKPVSEKKGIIYFDINTAEK